jgi:aminomethyltransferase
MSAPAAAPLLTTPLNALHIELGARMVPFAGYSMPVQYPAGLMAEHLHTRTPPACSTCRTWASCAWSAPMPPPRSRRLMPVDVIDLPVGKQRYGLLLNDEGGIIDDLMFFNQGVAHGRAHCSSSSTAPARWATSPTSRPASASAARCMPMPDHALLALQGPQAATALARLAPGVEKLVFMTGGNFSICRLRLLCHPQRLHRRRRLRNLGARRAGRHPGPRPAGPARSQAHRPGRAQLAAPGSRPVPVRQRHRHHHHARGSRAELGHPEGAPHRRRARRRLPRRRQGAGPARQPRQGLARKRVGLVALERVPVREHTELQTTDGQKIGEVTSGLLGPTVDKPIAMATWPRSTPPSAHA